MKIFEVTSRTKKIINEITAEDLLAGLRDRLTSRDYNRTTSWIEDDYNNFATQEDVDRFVQDAAEDHDNFWQMPYARAAREALFAVNVSAGSVENTGEQPIVPLDTVTDDPEAANQAAADAAIDSRMDGDAAAQQPLATGPQNGRGGQRALGITQPQSGAGDEAAAQAAIAQRQGSQAAADAAELRSITPATQGRYSVRRENTGGRQMFAIIDGETRMPARLRSTNVYYNTQEEAQAVADRLNQNNVQTVPRVGEPGNEIPGQTSAAPQTSPRPQPRPDMNLQGPAGGDMNLQGRTAQAAANAQDFTLSGNLRRGSSGPEVEQLQRALGFQDAEIDGRFGPRTEQAVRTFQQNQGLQVDGIVGRQTYNKILQTREDPRAQRNAGVGRIGQPTQQNQSKNNTGNKLTEAKEILRVTKLAGVPMRDIMNIITEANLSADEIRQLAQRLDDEDFTALQQARSGAGAAATAGNAQRLEVLDPQPPGYGFDQGQVLARNSEGRIYNINVSREVRIPFGSSQGQAGYRANSIPGTYQYDPANPQAPGMQNADNIYIPKDQLGQRGGQLAAPEPERQRQRSDAPQPTGPFTQDPEAGDGPEPSQTPDDFRLTQTLRRGSRGEQVRQLQTALGMTGNEVDGVFGPATEQAVRRFQQDRGIQVDGIVGQQTYNSILSTRENPRAQRNVAPGRIGQPTQQNQSIDMTGKEMAKLDEASLTVNGSASEISELMRMMQLAGAPSAKPVDSDDISSHIHNPEPSPCGAKPEPSMGDMISMISKEEEEVDGDFQDATTEPDNYYQDVSASIPSGNDLNRPKDRKAIRTVDPALETTLKDSLLQAYEGKYKSDAQRKAIWASKSEKKK